MRQGRDAPRRDGVVGGYRPWLDGVRAVAIFLVLVQHTMGSMPINPGSEGVALFFGLSGYLITPILLDEQALTGRVSLRGFYLRRAARLVPALVLVVVVCDALFLLAGDRGPLRGSLTALSYTSNYAEILRGDFVLGYGPTWTLAVEEHFYVLWPLALLWLTRRFSMRVVLRTTLALCALALLWRLTLAAAGAPFALLAMGSFERADALLYGCAAAIAVRTGWRPRAALLWAALALVVLHPVLFGSDTYLTYVAGSALLAAAVGGVVVCLDYSAPGWLRRVLSVRPVVQLGVLSYGVYLWHGPGMRIAADFGYSGRYWRAGCVLVAIVVAGVSYRFVERPVRSWARGRTAAEHRRPQPGALVQRPVAEGAGGST